MSEFPSHESESNLHRILTSNNYDGTCLRLLIKDNILASCQHTHSDNCQPKTKQINPTQSKASS